MDRTIDFEALVSVATRNLPQKLQNQFNRRSNQTVHPECEKFLQKACAIKKQIEECKKHIDRLENEFQTSNSIDNREGLINELSRVVQEDIQTISGEIAMISKIHAPDQLPPIFQVCFLDFFEVS